MKTLKSKRNRVVLENGIVKKTFLNTSLCEKEIRMYKQLEQHQIVPKLLEYNEDSIQIEFMKLPTYLDLLMEQEDIGLVMIPWDKLVQYLNVCLETTGLLPMDCNLSNFLWDESNSKTIGLDFEQYEKIELSECLERLSAFILLYDPIETELKKEIVQFYIHKYHLNEEHILEYKMVLIQRRKNKL